MEYVATKLNAASDELVTCDRFTKLAGNCEGPTAYRVGRTAEKALLAIPGGLSHVIMEAQDGTAALVQDQFATISDVNAAVGTSNGVIFPERSRQSRSLTESSQRETASGHASVVEVSIKENGSWFYVISGSALVLNGASGKLIKLSSGHEVFIPKARATARHENLRRNVHSFATSSVDAWWDSVTTTPTTPPPRPPTTTTAQTPFSITSAWLSDSAFGSSITAFPVGTTRVYINFDFSSGDTVAHTLRTAFTSPNGPWSDTSFTIDPGDNSYYIWTYANSGGPLPTGSWSVTYYLDGTEVGALPFTVG